MARLKSPSIDQRGFRRRLRRVLLLPFVLMATLLAVMLWQALALQRVEHRVRRSDEFIAETARLQVNLRELETAFDANLDAPSAKFGRVYQRLRADAARSLDALGAHDGASAARREQLAAVRALFDRWDGVVRSSVAPGGAVRDGTAGVAAKRAMEQLLPRLADLRRDERRARGAMIQHAQHATRLVIGSGIAVAVLLATALALFTRRQLVAVSAHYDRALDTARRQTLAFELARDRCEELLAQTRAALQLRDEFLQIAAHELRTPLTPMRIQVDKLARAAQAGADVAPEKLAAGLGSIRGSVDRLTRLVSDLLEISELRAGKIELALDELDLAEVARAAAERSRDALARAHCELRLEVAPGVRGRWDRHRLDQVLDVLICNAVKYGPGRPVEIRVEGADERARLVVRDHGVGIAPGDQERIFGIFERAVSERNYGGFGLGLWIARRVLSEMGGAIRVASEPGQGATFTVELPALVREAEAAEPAAGRADEVAAAPAARPSGARRSEPRFLVPQESHP